MNLFWARCLSAFLAYNFAMLGFIFKVLKEKIDSISQAIKESTPNELDVCFT